MKSPLKISYLFVAVIAFNIAYAQNNNEVNPIPKISNEWRFEVTPYLWLAGMKGTVGLNNGLAKSADFSPGDVLSNLKSGGMIAAEAHNGNWGIAGDLVSATLQNSGSVSMLTPAGAARIADKATVQ